DSKLAGDAHTVGPIELRQSAVTLFCYQHPIGAVHNIVEVLEPVIDRCVGHETYRRCPVTGFNRKCGNKVVHISTLGLLAEGIALDGSLLGDNTCMKRAV